MKICNKYAVVFAFLSCLAINNAFSVEYSSEGNFEGMFTGVNNIVGVFHSGVWFNPAGCANGEVDKAYLIEYPSAGDWSKVASMLLTAYTANEKIRVGVVPDRCYAGYPIIERVAFKNGL